MTSSEEDFHVCAAEDAGTVNAYIYTEVADQMKLETGKLALVWRRYSHVITVFRGR